MSTLGEIKRLPAFELARYLDGVAEVANATMGGTFLTGVRDTWVEAAEFNAADAFNRSFEASSLAETIGTAAQWAIFTDLAAWNVESPDGQAWDASDLRNVACAVLSYVAVELWEALSGDLETDDE